MSPVPIKNTRTHLKNNQNKKRMGHGSSDRVLIWQVQGTEFKLQHHKEGRKKRGDQGKKEGREGG
jgi:hypothetical protein